MRMTPAAHFFRIRDAPTLVFFSDTGIQRFKNLSFKFQKLIIGDAADIDIDFAMRSDGVNRRTTLDRPDIKRCVRLCRRCQMINQVTGMAHSVNSARHLTEVHEAVTTRAINGDLRIAIKADATTPYSVIKNVMNSLQDLRENRYNLITTLKTTSEE